MTSPTAVLLLSCRDQKGIVAAVSHFIWEHGGNIVDDEQHTDREQGLFLQRIEWQLAGFDLERDAIGPAFRSVAERFGMDVQLRFSDRRPRVAIFVSRQGHCLHDLLWRFRAGELRGEVALVASNHDDLREDVDRLGVSWSTFPVSGEDAGAREERILERLRGENVELVVLARYMQIVGGEFVRAFAGRAVNIHHSFLPAFAGARPYHQAHARGVKVIGATAHYVTEQLDEGPIIAQDVAAVSHRDDVEDLMRKGRDLEKVVLARAVDLHLRDRVLVCGNKTVVFD